MKNIKYIVLLFLIFIEINNVKAFDTSIKVYDYAQVLTAEEEKDLKRERNAYFPITILRSVISWFTRSTV